MATKQTTRNVALTPHFDEFVQAKIDSGRYQSASEVIREGLRLLEERELEKLRADIEHGYQQILRGEGLDGPSVFAEIREMSRAKREAMKKQKKK